MRSRASGRSRASSGGRGKLLLLWRTAAMAGFVSAVPTARGRRTRTAAEGVTRREVLAAIGAALAVVPGRATAKVEDMPAIRGRNFGKERTVYPDFTLTDSGLQYKDVRTGSGPTPRDGDRVVVDWEGYTIGYYGRIFAAKNKIKGGAFQEDQDFLRWVQGRHTVIPALEEAVATMKQGGIRQVVIPPELGYPDSDPKHDRVGPKPKTFSGQRALDFVLFNKGLIDKTLLINVELMRVDRPGERNFKG
mmetsp:Transcript_7756/g.23473  ORF Transcript_7756/g.23473 Transcript_7756/m.23473 type:complete len:248 (+) Transcript_7756:63-806(+)